MSMKRILGVCLLGAASLIFQPTRPAEAQALRVVEGQSTGTLRVPMNRAVVVESETLFAELSVANPAIADIATLSERSIYVLGRAPGRTTMTLLGADGSLIANVEIQVVADLAELRERLAEIIPGEHIEVRTANDGIVLSGTVSSALAIDRAMELANRYGSVSNLMMVGGQQQVMMQVRFSEMTRSVRRELGTSLNGTNTGQQDGAGSFNTGNLVQFPVGTNPPGGIGGLTTGGAIGSFSLTLLLEALESQGLVRTLAEPNLSAISGQSASFLAGGEFPIPSRQEDGTVAVVLQPFGIELDFTPTVVGDGVINLQLSTSVSAIDAEIPGNSSGVPGLRTREASTTVEMRDGESFAIAGLLQDDFRSTVGQVPWLGEVPILGALFRSASYQREQSELVIIVTAHLVSPVRGEALALPSDRIQVPTARDLFLNGNTSGGRPAAGSAAAEVAQQDFTGSYGYVMD